MFSKRIVIAVVASVFVLVLIGSFAAQMYQQKIFLYAYSNSARDLQVYSGITSLKAVTIDEYCRLAFFPSTVVQAFQSPISNSSTRMQIYDLISENPGVQFRAISAALCLPIGLVQYHLGVLFRYGLVSFVRDGRYKRFFISKRFSKRGMSAISLLRHKTVKKIVEVLLCKKQLSHGKLAAEVSITSQGLTWQMRAYQEY